MGKFKVYHQHDAMQCGQTACAWLIKDNGTPLINLIFAYI